MFGTWKLINNYWVKFGDVDLWQQQKTFRFVFNWVHKHFHVIKWVDKILMTSSLSSAQSLKNLDKLVSLGRLSSDCIEVVHNIHASFCLKSTDSFRWKYRLKRQY